MAMAPSPKHEQHKRETMSAALETAAATFFIGQAVGQVAFCPRPQGTLVALGTTGDDDANKVSLWSLDVDGESKAHDESELAFLPQVECDHCAGGVNSLAVGKTRDARVLVTAGSSGGISVFSVAPGRDLSIVDKTPAAWTKAHAAAATGIAFESDNERIASVSEDASVCVFHVHDEAPLWTQAQASGIALNDVCFQTNSTLITAGASPQAQLSVWDIRQAKPAALFRDPTPGIILQSVVRHPLRSDLVATGDSSGTVNVWDLTAKRLLTSHRAHSSHVWDVVFHDEEPQFLFSASEDGTVVKWDFNTSQKGAVTYDGDTTSNLSIVRLQKATMGINSIACDRDMLVSACDNEAVIVSSRLGVTPMHRMLGSREPEEQCSGFKLATRNCSHGSADHTVRVQLVPMSSAVVQVSSDQAEGIPTNMPRQAEKNEQKAAQEELASPEQLLEVRKWRGHTLRTPARRSHSHDKPFRHHLILATRPCLAQSIACSALLFFAVVFLASVAAGGDKVLRFSTAVPMYLREHKTRVRRDAILAGKLVANAEAATTTPKQQEVGEFKLQIMYMGRNGRNVLQGSDLARIKALEEKIMANPEYPNFCQKVYAPNTNVSGSASGVCARPVSSVYFFDPAYFAPTHTSYDPPSPSLCPLDTSRNPPTCNGTIASWNMNNTRLVQQSMFADSGMFPTNMDFSSSNIATTSAYWSSYHTKPFSFISQDNFGDYAQTTLSNMFYRVSDAGFGLQDDGSVGTTASALLTTFFIGLPLEGFTETDGEAFTEQEDKIGQFLFDNYQDLLEGESEWEDEFVVLWDGPGMNQRFISTELTTNMLLVFGSIFFVLLYISAVTGSLYIGMMGVAQIFLAFPPAILLYRFVFGFTYFGTLNMMAIFIILGIGADDIFVMLDTWNQNKVHLRGKSIPVRMTATLRHAGKAMATTSVSTCFAFFANATSSFPAVYTFGIFCAVLVLCNYIAVCFFFPCVIVVREKFFANKRCCFVFCCCCNRQAASTAKKAPAAAAPADAATSASAPVKSGEDVSRVAVWFRDTYYNKFIHPYRIPILIAYGIMVIVFAIFAAQVVPDPEAPALFFDGNNYQEYRPAFKKLFPREGNPSQIKAQIVFGISELIRGDSDPTDPDDYGEVKFDRQLDITTADAQTYLVNLCQDVRSDRTAAARKVASPTEVNPEPVMCFMESFRDWALRNNKGFPVVGTEAEVIAAYREWMSAKVLPGETGYRPGAIQYSVWSPYVFVEGNSGSSRLRFAIVEVATTIEQETAFAEGIKVFEAWEDWMQDMLLTAPDGMKTGFVTDAGGFHYFYLQDTILQEAVFGIILSVALAFIVLVMATGNYIVSAMATGAILLMVMQVVGFTVMMGWKLGVMEAIVYVMVVGLSVDFVVHLSDAYLESGKEARGERVRKMLAMMGLSIISGAVSTLGASFFLLMGTIVFFYKFGAVIFFIISLALVTSLVAFAALMDWKGPEGEEGLVTFGAVVMTCCWRANQSFWRWMEDDQTTVERLEEKISMLSFEVRQLRNQNSPPSAPEDTLIPVTQDDIQATNNV